MRRAHTAIAAVGAAAMALLSCSSGRPCDGRPTAAAAPAVGAAEAVAISATIVRVEPKRRVVTLQTPDGRRVTVRAHASVKDLEKLRPGDLVSATYYESIAYGVKKPGAATPSVAAAEASRGPKPGQLPAAADARVVTVTARVTDVDAKAGTVTLQAPDAHPVTVRVKDAAALADVKDGDLMQVTCTEAVAVAIDVPH